MWTRLGTLACLIFLAVLPVYVVATLVIKARRSRQEAVAYIRGFKKGSCVLVYLPAVVLYWLGLCNGGFGIGEGFFEAVARSIGLVVLRYDMDNITALMKEDGLYGFTMYFCFALVLLNALMFTLSVFLQNLWGVGQTLRIFFSRKDRLILLGNNADNVAIYHSETRRCKLLLESATGKDRKQLEKEKETLYMNRVASRFEYALPATLRRFLRQAVSKGWSNVIIVNTQDDKRNISLCKLMVDQIKAMPKQEQEQLFRKLQIYVFGDHRYETIYADLVQNSLGMVRYVNTHLKVAMDFVDQYPFTRFMDERQIDYETSLIRPDVEINGVFIGFGKTNQQIFMTSVANNQFLTGTPEDPRLKQVCYHIFDKEPAENNKNLNHSYYRYKNECCDEAGNCLLTTDTHLPAPEQPARECYYHLDINDHLFYQNIRTIVDRKPQDVNFVVIAFGTDLENLDMAQKLVEKRKEWGLKNLYIFVKVRDWKKEQTFLEEDGCYFIGRQKDVVLDVEKITGDRIYAMSQLRDVVYSAEAKKHERQGLTEEEYFAQKVRDWHAKKNQIERESSLYSCLSLRSKLQLMGLDYCREDEDDRPGLTQQQFWLHYAGEDDLPQVSGECNGRAEIEYGLNFKQSRRRTMAIHEHLRWNSFIISRGLIPASLEQIKNEQKDGCYTNGKDYAVRRHGNLTTFDGLVTFRQIVVQRDGCREEDADVIKYDYQILDHAHWLLTRQGYKIVKR